MQNIFLLHRLLSFILIHHEPLRYLNNILFSNTKDIFEPRIDFMINLLQVLLNGPYVPQTVLFGMTFPLQ